MEERKFKIICLECSSENVHIVEDIDYDYDETPYVAGYFLKCLNCGSSEEA